MLSNDRQLRDLALNAGMRGAELTHRFLAFARRQPLDPKPTAVNDLVNDAVSLMRHTLGDNVTVRTSLAVGLDNILIDPSQLESALLNLAINARDAMPEGGTLLIETAAAQLDAAYAVQHPDARPGKYVMMSVSDQGTGIAPDILPHVFEPFFTTKEVGKGSGLGLSMVYGFIKQSDGHVRIYSEVGHGTTVRLYLPICRAPSANESRSVEAIDLPRGKERILLVEDDDGVRQFLTVLLTEFGYEVVAVASAVDLPEVMSHDVTFDMLITDIVLPGGRNGKEVADVVRPRLPKPRVLFISGYPRDAVVPNARLEEAVDFISKPFTREVILTRVREILDRD